MNCWLVSIQEDDKPRQCLWIGSVCLGFIPDRVVTKTLTATTQLVPSMELETREIMRDQFQTRLPELKVRWVNDVCYVDTFFSSLPLVRGFTCWNLFSLLEPIFLSGDWVGHCILDYALVAESNYSSSDGNQLLCAD